MPRSKIATGYACLAALLLGLGGAVAQEPADGRFEMTPVPEGQVRLDTETGAMSLCRRSGEQWACTPMAESDLQSEVQRLQRENQELRDKIAAFEDASANKPGGQDSGEPGFQLTIPKKEIERLKEFAQDLYRRFQDLIRDLQDQREEKPI